MAVNYGQQQWGDDLFEDYMVVDEVATPPTNTIIDYRGKEYDKDTLVSLAQQIAPTLDKDNLAGGVYSTNNANIGFAYDEATNALGYKPTAAEQVVLDMARHLIDTGVTDLNQVQAGDQNQRFGSTYTGEGGTIYEIKRDPTTGEVVTSTWGKTTSDKGNIVAALSIGAGLLGLPTQVGTAILGAGASPVAASALGGALLGGTTSALTGGDVLKGALLGGAGGAVSGYLQNGPIDASNMTSAQFNDALETQLIGEMQKAGLNNAQITQFLENASAVDIASVVNALPSATDNLVVQATKTPITADALTNVLSQVPALTVTSTRPQQVSPDTIGAITSTLSGGTTPSPIVEVTAERPNKTDIPVVTTPTVTTPSVISPVVTPTTTTTTDTKKDTSLTASDVVKLISAGATITGINAAVNGGSSSGATQYPIIPIPESWATPPKTSVAPFTPLTPINFGNRNLLIGTQWEKFLDPNYGKVPEPVKFAQPSNLSYNDLMGILGSKQGYPLASSLSINDIISGIQNQYGQANQSTMG
jgi:hypothetical protein